MASQDRSITWWCRFFQRETHDSCYGGGDGNYHPLGPRGGLNSRQISSWQREVFVLLAIVLG